MCSEFPHFQTLIDLIISKIADSLFWLISWGECQWFVVILGLLIQIFELVDAWKQYTNGGPDISLFSKNFVVVSILIRYKGGLVPQRRFNTSFC